MIKAIETEYNGYKFRSRLEARWAVFFDAMNIPYYYEHEGYERTFGDGEDPIRYLPDFYLPKHRLWAEVKGVTCRGEIPPEDAERISWMIDFDGPCSNGVVMLGDIPEPKGATSMDWAIWKWTGKGLKWGYCIGHEPPPDGWDLMELDYQVAPWSFDKNDDIVLTTSISAEEFDLHKEFPRVIPSVEKALLKARQARFEHGEKPII